MPCYVMCMFYFNPDSNRDCSKKEFEFCFFCFGFWAEGLGVNAQNPKLLILFK